MKDKSDEKAWFVCLTNNSFGDILAAESKALQYFPRWNAGERRFIPRGMAKRCSGPDSPIIEADGSEPISGPYYEPVKPMGVAQDIAKMYPDKPIAYIAEKQTKIGELREALRHFGYRTEWPVGEVRLIPPSLARAFGDAITPNMPGTIPTQLDFEATNREFMARNPIHKEPTAAELAKAKSDRITTVKEELKHLGINPKDPYAMRLQAELNQLEGHS
jgi:hypothetical protein